MTPPPRLRICVYCGSRSGRSPRMVELARALGAGLAARGLGLVYGGGRVGLMGAVADAVLAGGGEAVGVIPQALLAREVGHPGLSELHVVQTMHERKQGMAERADAFVTLPGGIGTLEELFEVWSWRYLGYHDKPVALLNAEGYYDALLRFMAHARDSGYVSDAQHAALIVDDDVGRLLDRVVDAAQRADAPDDYSQI
jgi:uncharacterized protein (TIGR00730 family)